MISNCHGRTDGQRKLQRSPTEKCLPVEYKLGHDKAVGGAVVWSTEVHQDKQEPDEAWKMRH